MTDPRDFGYTAAFADRGSAWRLFIGVLIVLGLGGYNAHSTARLALDYRDCVASPTAHDGATVILPLWSVSTILGPQRYLLSDGVRDVPIDGPTLALHPGDILSVRGHCRGLDPVIVEVARQSHPLRRWKERLGLLGLVLAGVAAPLVFRIEAGRLVARG